MAHTQDLFMLIHSLDKNEKGYFRKFSSGHGKGRERAYLKLFTFLARQEQYDEKKVRAHFRDERFTRQLAVAQDYLFNQILKSLESYHQGVDAGLCSQLHRISILFEKGLYDTCLRMVQRAQRTAEKYERHHYLLELLNWEVELARARSYAGLAEAEMKRLFSKISSVTETSSRINTHSALVSSLFMKEVKGGFARSRSGLEQYEAVIRHPLLRNRRKQGSYQERFYFLLSHMGYHAIRNEFDKAYGFSFRLVEWIEQHPHQLSERPRAYVSALRNQVTCLGKLKRYREIPAVLEKMKNVRTRSRALQRNIFYSATILGMETCLHTGDLETGLELVKLSEIQRARLRSEPLNKLNETILNYNTACLLFCAGRLSSANQYLNRILNDTQIDLRSDIQCFARILRLLVHFEMGNDDLLPYLLRSTYRYLLKRNSLYRFEALVLDFIRKKLPATTTRKELLAAFAGLKAGLDKLAKDPFEQTALEYFDLISWLESKVSGKGLMQVIREKQAPG
jgi:hypothetical protein